MAKASVDIVALQREVTNRGDTINELNRQISNLKADNDRLREERNEKGTRLKLVEDDLLGTQKLLEAAQADIRTLNAKGTVPTSDDATAVITFIATEHAEGMRSPAFRRNINTLVLKAWNAYHDMKFIYGIREFLSSVWGPTNSPIGQLDIIIRERLATARIEEHQEAQKHQKAVTDSLTTSPAG
jgi:hypothetical protein